MDSSTPPSSSTSATQLPAKLITKHPATFGQINPEWMLLLEGLLQVAHDKMDEDNVKIAMGAYCRWCKGPHGYNAQGIIHDDECILVRIRQVLP